MKYIKLLPIIFVISIIIAACSTDSESPTETTNNFDRGAMLVNWADNIIIPAYTSFSSKATALKTETTNFTANPSVDNLQSLRASWKDAYVAFQTVSMFEIGKAEEVRFRNRLNVYPANASQIENFIASGVYDFNLPSTIDNQGFPAIDYMINGIAATDTEIVAFYTSNGNAEGYKNYLQTLSNTISNLSNEVLTSWTSGYRDVFVANVSSSASGAVDKLTNDYIFYFEKALRAGKVGIPAGVFSGSILPGNVEAFYKKDISKELLLKAIEASTNFFNGKSFASGTNGPSFKTYLDFLNTIKNGENLSSIINTEFTAAKTKAATLNNNFAEQVQTDNAKMLETYDELQRIVIYLKVDMIQALNISIDYVDADGD